MRPNGGGKGPAGSWSKKQKKEFQNVKELVEQAPWLYMRKDALAYFFKLKRNQALTLDTSEVYTRLGMETIPVNGIHFVIFPWKRAYVQQFAPLEVETRIRYLTMPAKYPLTTLHVMYTQVYGPLDQTEFRQRVVQVWGVAKSGKFVVQGYQDTTVWPAYCTASPNALSIPSYQQKRSAEDYISLSESESETVYSSSGRYAHPSVLTPLVFYFIPKNKRKGNY
jgi:hypothetical protein